MTIPVTVVAVVLRQGRVRGTRMRWAGTTTSSTMTIGTAAGMRCEPVDVVTPDVELWAHLSEYWRLMGAELAAVLLACVAGGALSALLWGVGNAIGLPRLVSRGKWGVVGSVVAAMAAAGMGPLYGWVISIFS